MDRRSTSKWGRSGSELGWDCLPIPRQELIEILDVVIVDAGQHVGQPFLGIDVIQFGGLDQGVHHGRPLSATVGAGEQPRFAAERNRAVILPMSGKKLKFVTAGMHSMGGAFAANTRSGALAARSFTSKRRPAWSSSWPRGCSIRPPAPE